MGVPLKLQLFLINTLMTTTRNGNIFLAAANLISDFLLHLRLMKRGLQKVCKVETVNQQLFNFLVSLFCSIQQQHRKQNQISKCSGEQCN